MNEIDVIETLSSYGVPQDEEQFREALDLAIKTLGQKSRKGHWILADVQSKEDTDNDNYRYICSECQCSDIHAKSVEVPYCWKCGAMMTDKGEE